MRLLVIQLNNFETMGNETWLHFMIWLCNYSHSDIIHLLIYKQISILEAHEVLQQALTSDYRYPWVVIMNRGCHGSWALISALLHTSDCSQIYNLETKKRYSGCLFKIEHDVSRFDSSRYARDERRPRLFYTERPQRHHNPAYTIGQFLSNGQESQTFPLIWRLGLVPKAERCNLLADRRPF